MAALLQALLLFLQLAFCLAQTTTIDVPFLGITSKPLTAAIVHAESATTVFRFSCDGTTVCGPSNAFPWQHLTLAPTLDAMTYSMHRGPDDSNKLDGPPWASKLPCYLLPRNSSSVAYCAAPWGDDFDRTWSNITTLPVTITSGAERLASAEATTTDSNTSGVTTLTIAMPGVADNKPNFASIVSRDASTTVLEFDAYYATLRYGLTQVATFGPSTWIFKYNDDTFTRIDDCHYNDQPEFAATCIESAGGPKANFPGTETSTYPAESMVNVEVTITEGPSPYRTTLALPMIAAYQSGSVSASVVAADSTETSLSFKFGHGPDIGVIFSQQLLIGPSTWSFFDQNDQVSWISDCEFISSSYGAICKISVDGTSVQGSTTTTATFEPSESWVDTVTVTIYDGAEKLPGYTPTATMVGTGPNATPGSASTGALPSATDSTSGSSDRPALTNASLAGILALLATLCFL